MGNWRQSPEGKKLSDNVTTDGDPGASVLCNDVAWLDNVENDRQKKSAVINWRHHLKREKGKKNRVTTRRQTVTLVRPFSEMMWSGTTK